MASSQQSSAARRVDDTVHQFGAPKISVGQFSLAPTTQTTVVTTTTTTTTTFPPLVLNQPRSLYERDFEQYPLAAAPTPQNLKRLCFDVNGKPTHFREADDPELTLQNADQLYLQIEEGNGIVRSEHEVVADSPFTKKPTPTRGSRNLQSLNDTSRKRAGSPVSLFEAAERVATIQNHQSHRNKRRQTLRIQADTTPTSSVPSTAKSLRTRGRPSPDNSRQTHSPQPLRPVHSQLSQLQHFSHTTHQQETPLTLSPQLGPRVNSEISHIDPLDSQDDLAMVESLAGTSTLPSNLISATPPPVSPEISAPVTPRTLQSNEDDNSGEANQPLSLPSPSLSPVTAAALTQRNASYFPSIDSSSSSIDTALERTTNYDQSFNDTLYDMSMQTSSRRAPTTLMDIPNMLDSFDAMPTELKDYMMYQFLRRCSKTNLKFVADVVNPTLKCDFLARLPLELSLSIIKYLDVKSLCRAAQTSKKWRRIIDTDEWIWKKRLEEDDYTVPRGELERAIKEGWGYQVPDYSTYPDCEIDLSELVRDLSPSPSPSRKPKRKCTRSFIKQQQKQRETIKDASIQDLSKEEFKEMITGLINNELMPGITPDQASMLPQSVAGLPSLRNYHLYKSIYRRNHLIRNGWSRADVKPKHISFPGHPDHVITCLQFDADKILTGSDDTNINVYDTRTGALKNTLIGHEGGVWALEYVGNTLVSGSTDRTVRVWDIEKGECTQVFVGHTSTVRCLKILKPTKIGNQMLPPEPLIITGSRDSTVRIWKLPKLNDRPYAPPRGTETTVTTGALSALMNNNPYYVRTLSSHTNSVRTIDCYGDTLVSGSYDYSVRVWKIGTGECVHRLQGHTNKVYSVVLDHARNRCISGSMDHLVKVWDLATGTAVFTLQGHNALVGLLDLSHDWLVSAAADATLRIWDPETGHCKHTLRSHQTAITCFQHDGHKVVSGSDGTLKMFDLRTGKFIRDLLTDLNLVWQVKFNERQCVAAVQRAGGVFIEVLDFGAARDGVPDERLGVRIVVDNNGVEVAEGSITEEQDEGMEIPFL